MTIFPHLCGSKNERTDVFFTRDVLLTSGCFHLLGVDTTPHGGGASAVRITTAKQNSELVRFDAGTSWINPENVDELGIAAKVDRLAHLTSSGQMIDLGPSQPQSQGVTSDPHLHDRYGV